MEINTKFNVGDLIKHKYTSQSKKRKFALFVKEVTTQTCYAGTQVFYICRLIFVEKILDSKFDEEGTFEWVTGFNHEQKLCKLREDELTDLDKETLDIISKANGLDDK